MSRLGRDHSRQFRRYRRCRPSFAALPQAEPDSNRRKILHPQSQQRDFLVQCNICGRDIRQRRPIDRAAAESSGIAPRPKRPALKLGTVHSNTDFLTLRPGRARSFIIVTRMSDISELLERFRRGAELVAVSITGAAGAELDWAPEPGKWSIRKIIAHLAGSG